MRKHASHSMRQNAMGSYGTPPNLVMETVWVLLVLHRQKRQ